MSRRHVRSLFVAVRLEFPHFLLPDAQPWERLEIHRHENTDCLQSSSKRKKSGRCWQVTQDPFSTNQVKALGYVLLPQTNCSAPFSASGRGGWFASEDVTCSFMRVVLMS
ncbi:hypothetical protein GN956_G13174 [Arapaima gigas]